jgi:sulfur carrier protein
MAAIEPHAGAGRHLHIALNGEPRRTVARTLAELIAEAGYSGAKVATAVNGEFVAERARAARLLAEGDQVEVVAPRQGG